MKYYFIRCEYKVENDTPVIFLWGRRLDTQEKILFRVTGFESRFYVPEDEEVPQSSAIKRVVSGFKSIFGEPVKMIVTQIPEDVKELRKFFRKTSEADIPFTRNFLIETGIRRYFTVPDGRQEVNYREIVGE